MLVHDSTIFEVAMFTCTDSKVLVEIKATSTCPDSSKTSESRQTPDRKAGDTSHHLDTNIVLETRPLPPPHDAHCLHRGGHLLPNSLERSPCMLVMCVWTRQTFKKTLDEFIAALSWIGKEQCWITRHHKKRSSTRTVSGPTPAAFEGPELKTPRSVTDDLVVLRCKDRSQNSINKDRRARANLTVRM